LSAPAADGIVPALAAIVVQGIVLAVVPDPEHAPVATGPVAIQAVDAQADQRTVAVVPAVETVAADGLAAITARSQFHPSLLFG
jgi:hypothetical protein